jgi:hypothetical protein
LGIVAKYSHYTPSARLTVTNSNTKHFSVEILSLKEWPYNLNCRDKAV